MKTLNLLLLLLCSWLPIFAQDVIITEIHHSPSNDNRSLEFIEIYNSSDKPIDLSGWELSKGITYTFPQQVELSPQSYILVAKSPAQVYTTYQLEGDVQIVGPFEGQLSKKGENLVLLNTSKQTIDKVHYKDQSPWPLCYGQKEQSLQLVNTSFDNRVGTHWATALPSPCTQNKAVLTTRYPPIIKSVRHYPQAPTSTETVTIRANVRNAHTVKLLYQIVHPGHYIALKDSAYQNNWVELKMQDNGKNGDATANDRIYTILMPSELQEHRHLMRYKIVAQGDTVSTAPHPSDPQVNFAYYTYDKLPDYKGHNLEQLPQLPVCQLLAKADDVQHLIYEYKKRKYLATGTVVYNGKVYDHIGYRSRGYNNRHSRTKRNLKFNFHSNHKLAVVDDYGKKYKTKRNKLVLSGGWLLDKPNTHGLAESVLYRLFTMQGTSSSYADYLHLRVVDHENEVDTINGDFWGVYLMLENYDGDFLKTHDLPDANIYSYKPYKVRHSSDKDIEAQEAAYSLWDTSYHSSHSADWWKKEIDWENYIGFLIGNELIGNRETGYRKQHWWTEYRHPQKGWQFFPWDVDKTWSSSRGKSTISYSIFSKAFEHAQLEKEYKNELRSVLDLLFNEEQVHQLIDEEAAPIYNAKAAYSFADLDKLRWGHKYEGGFDTQIAYMKRFVKRRRQYILDNLLDDNIPDTPTIHYRGKEGFPIEALSFAYKNVVLNSTVSVQWRIAEVDKNSNTNKPKKYEIHSIWEQEEQAPFSPFITIPKNTLKPNRDYRIRVRVQDTSGYYSHWSAPIEFSPSIALSNYGEGLVINELLFDAVDNLEFIELYNNTDQEINLEGFIFKKGIKYEFPTATTIAPKGYWVLTNNAEKFKQKYNFEADDSYKGKLSNEGEQLAIYNPSYYLIDSLNYSASWINSTTEQGRSLELTAAEEDNSIAQNWHTSSSLWGTPKAINSSLSPIQAINSWYWPLIAVLILSFGILQRFKPKRSLG
ncbi:MAG: hypothetical protein GY810_27040 [Aureispira sp.]|nr:hypothetical protein [Aureispira sp.]